MTQPETLILVVAIVLVLIACRPRHGRRRVGRRRVRNHHSFLYRHYIDNNSRLWRFRRWQWFMTSNKHCEKCGTRVCLHRNSLSRRFGATPAQFHHLNYQHVAFERRGRDIQMLCERCHCRISRTGRR
jgi:hypothetical protein